MRHSTRIELLLFCSLLCLAVAVASVTAGVVFNALAVGIVASVSALLLGSALTVVAGRQL